MAEKTSNMKKVDIIGKTKVWLGISSLLVLAAIISLAIFGLNLSIEFTGGSLMEIQSESATIEQIEEVFEGEGRQVIVQPGESGDFIVRTEIMSPEEHVVILEGLEESFGAFEELRFESIGPVIGEELKRKSFVAVVILVLLIICYVAWAFRRVSKPVSSWKYGILTIVAALHDMIIPIGVFAILGHVLDYQIGTAFVAALLTILGYSINDTIVVFDRTRENLVENRHSDERFSETVNRSVLQSFARSMNTSLTTLLVLLAVYFFGGESTKTFVLALMIGIVSGAYSSIFLASPLLVLWQKK